MTERERGSRGAICKLATGHCRDTTANRSALNYSPFGAAEASVDGRPGKSAQPGADKAVAESAALQHRDRAANKMR
ncbi:MAG: hypothetical protein E6Q27_08975 [Aeromicrobium sp.]|nr:MAG: hypothetical protein E6Q27_08975 [Aeromicrobium sp.]